VVEPILRRAFESLPSTQAYAADWVRNGLTGSARVVAHAQTQGRGRGAHSWSSPIGGLYLSSVVPCRTPPTALTSLLVSGAIADLLRDRFRISPNVKWPNDLIVPHEDGSYQKLGGIILDMLDPTGGKTAIVGVGLNLASRRADFSSELRPGVAILCELTPEPVDIDELEESVDRTIRDAVSDGASADARGERMARLREILFGVGRRVKIDGADVGRMLDVGPSGELLVRGSDGDRSIWAGDLTFEAIE
jgi:BirA family transcriptional regulator, biotin operon repressor / biotin---[acetyl-CoA-carboxylase] ligase